MNSGYLSWESRTEETGQPIQAHWIIWQLQQQRTKRQLNNNKYTHAKRARKINENAGACGAM